jgi:Cu-Zn family superoxide dismutase
MIRISRLSLPALVCFLAVACQHNDNKQPSTETNKEMPHKVAVAYIHPAKAASTQPAGGNASGTVTFTQMGDKVQVVADLTGLAPGKHGFHIHEKGDLSSPDLASAGGHFNPGGHPHGGPTTSAVHEGDLGNILASSDGTAHLKITVNDITIGTRQPNDILGRSVIVHAKPDDLTSQPSGNSGPRIAGGTIEPAMDGG